MVILNWNALKCFSVIEKIDQPAVQRKQLPESLFLRGRWVIELQRQRKPSSTGFYIPVYWCVIFTKSILKGKWDYHLTSACRENYRYAFLDLWQMFWSRLCFVIIEYKVNFNRAECDDSWRCNNATKNCHSSNARQYSIMEGSWRAFMVSVFLLLDSSR